MRSAVLLAALLLPAVAHAQEYGDYHALVIGNNAYQHVEKLKTAVADARAVAKLLRDRYGFRTTLLSNATRRQIVSALNSYRKTLKPTDNLLVYYAGHGYLDAEASEGYWLPIDARDDDDSQWISNATITTRLRTIPAKHVMVISDSCYSGSLTRGLSVKLRGPQDYAATAAKRARVVLTSGGLEPVEDSGGGDHSIFAKTFLDVLTTNTGVLSGTVLFKKLVPRVRLGADQVPQYGNIRRCGHEEGGDFLFVRQGSNAARRTADANAEATRLRRELAALQARQESDEKATRAELESAALRRKLAEAKRRSDAASRKGDLEHQLAAVARSSARFAGTVFKKDGTSVTGKIRVTKRQNLRHVGVVATNGRIEIVHHDDIARIEWTGIPPVVDKELDALEERLAAIAAEKERKREAVEARRIREERRRADDERKRELLSELNAHEARQEKARADASNRAAQKAKAEAQRAKDAEVQRLQTIENDKARRVQQILSNLDPACKHVKDLPRIEGYSWTLEGYTWLRNETFECAGQKHTLAVYRNDAFAQALRLPKSKSVYACEFVLIPGGTFSMGTLHRSPVAAPPPHPRTLPRAFLIGRTEVIRTVWETFFPSKRSAPKGGRRPVENVSWYEAQKFCRRTRIRLPTEAEWEQACRGGSEREYCFGNDEADLRAYGWFDPIAFKHAQAVATKKPNAFGIFDMHGNVREWVEDTYAPDTRFRINKGGDWASPAGASRAGLRRADPQDRKALQLGFRPAASLPR